ncbi:winged helix-turn-helix transcriptional regulator [Peribacillus sp. FSL E2-0159]|uniref:winged helix-turn-helix transcriptional regulator n=1 Tax=Peribacillus sp. FSL E2-0159 TaxID=2975289 RepID=UPI00315A9477
MGVVYVQHILSWRWKLLILLFLKDKAYCFGEIKNILNEISQGSLTKQLRKLEADGLIKREVFPEVPPKVEYSLTDKGEKLIPIMTMLEQFGQDCT